MKRITLLCLFASSLAILAADPIPGESLFSEPKFTQGSTWKADINRTTQMFLTTEYIVAGDNRMQEVDQLQVQEEVYSQTVNAINPAGEIRDFTRSYEKQTLSNKGQPAVAGPLQGLTFVVQPDNEAQKMQIYRSDDSEKKAVDLDTNLKLKMLDEDQALPNKVYRILEDIFAGSQIKQGDTLDVPDTTVISLLDFSNNAASLMPSETDLKVTVEKISDDEAQLRYSGKISLVIGSSLDPNGRMNFNLEIEDWVCVYRRNPFFELQRNVKGNVHINSIREIGDAIINTSGNGSLSEKRTVTLP